VAGGDGAYHLEQALVDDQVLRPPPGQRAAEVVRGEIVVLTVPLSMPRPSGL
jgi:hypothetical protein